MSTLPRTSLSIHSLLDNSYSRFFHQRHSIGLSERSGQKVSRRRGQGIEFDDLRLYTHGDDLRHIDWNTTARANTLYTRLFRDDKDRTTTIMLDFRRNMFTGTQYLKAVNAGLLASRILWCASFAGDRCSVIVLSESGMTLSTPRPGSSGVVMACELIAREFERCQALSHNETKSTNKCSDELLSWLMRKGKRAGVLLFLSDFDNATDQWFQMLQVASRKKKIFCIPVYDPGDVSGIATGRYAYLSEERVRLAVVNSSFQQELVDSLQMERDSLKQFFKTNNILFIEVTEWESDAVVCKSLVMHGYL